ncbi:MAG: transcription elongation factor GreA [bacterium]|nr:transcription elongation factor GreA [bacterium]
MSGSERVYLTRNGYNKLKKELDHLKKVERKETSQAIKEAREQGDLSENAEYDAAKEKQGRVESKIVQLEDKLSRAVIMDPKEFDDSEVRIGSKVKLKNLENNTEIEYTLVDVSEADFSVGKISINSPVGQGLLGYKKGEKVEIELPVNILRLEVLDITRE